MGLVRMICCGALTREYSDAGNRIHEDGCIHQRKRDIPMGDEKAAEYEALSNDWPKDREVGALDPEDQEPQETPADDGDKTSAIVFDDENVDGIPNDDDEVDLPADAEDDDDEEF